MKKELVGKIFCLHIFFPSLSPCFFSFFFPSFSFPPLDANLISNLDCMSLEKRLVICNSGIWVLSIFVFAFIVPQQLMSNNCEINDET